MNGIADHLDDLMRPEAWPQPVSRIQRIETHISWVFLTGEYAWKIKKPVDLGFLDFSTPEKRRFFCEEELRLNRRLAPELYLSVDTVCLHEGRLHVGGEGQVVDYAVRMRQFDPEQQLDRMLARGELQASHIDALARHIARFHAEVAVAGEDQPWGDVEHVLEPMLANFAHIRQCAVLPPDDPRLAELEQWTRAQGAALAERLAQRKAEGFIRECHGDLHLGNMALMGGEVVAFDCLEFNPSLRWIDIISEVAFTVMDLEDRGARGLAQGFLDGWLTHGGDYGGVALLDFYKVYRAMVRAKVNAIRQQQLGDDAAAREAAQKEVAAYLGMAQAYTQAARSAAPVLVLTHGLSASGKSTVSGALLEHARAIRLRSDVERKRLFGLAPEARSASGVAAGIYDAEATARTYGRLRELAAELLASGYAVIVDAAFLRREQREAFYALAGESRVPCVVLDLTAPEAELRRRISTRRGDASEADLKVLEHQLQSAVPLSDEELSAAGARRVRVDSTRPLEAQALAREVGLA